MKTTEKLQIVYGMITAAEATLSDFVANELWDRQLCDADHNDIKTLAKDLLGLKSFSAAVLIQLKERK